jgi:hypothetical protein
MPNNKILIEIFTGCTRVADPHQVDADPDLVEQNP